MILFAIETSCDETAVSIVKVNKNYTRFKVLSNKLISQIDIHKEFGGVYPNIAKREHIKNLPILINSALKEAKLNIKNIDAVAVTAGPGLAPALWVGIEEAKKIAKENNIPIYAINHMHGHILSSLVQKIKENEYKILEVNYPALAFLISGGHTEIIFMKNEKSYEKISETLDDAIGEAFDKVARCLGLEYPGGPKISRLAEKARQKRLMVDEKWRLPRPMLNSQDLNFSFSGLKTAVLYRSQKFPPQNEEEKEAICMEFENAVTDVIIKKLEKAIYFYNVKTLIVGGGVSANKHIRYNLEELCKKENIKLFLPDIKLSNDNALMIAISAIQNIKNNQKETKIENLKAISNWSVA